MAADARDEGRRRFSRGLFHGLFHQLDLAGVHDRLQPADRAELAGDVVEMRLDRPRRDEQLRGDLPVGAPGGQVPHHLDLARAERLASVGRPG